MLGRFGGFQKQVALGLWIHDRLQERGEDYIERMWNAYCDEVMTMPLGRPRIPSRRKVKETFRRTHYKIPTYTSFAKYFYLLRRLKLIEFVREETAKGAAMNRRYYRVAPGAELDPKWENPAKWAFMR